MGEEGYCLEGSGVGLGLGPHWGEGKPGGRAGCCFDRLGPSGRGCLQQLEEPGCGRMWRM